jgi:chloramphenicol 3-O phosphotransferase
LGRICQKVDISLKNMKNGLIIFLNGTSSAGKTTIAKALQEKLVEPYMHVSVDDFINMYPEKFLNPTSEAEAVILSHLLFSAISGFHKCVAVLAQTGNSVIVDHVLQEDGWLKECVESWQDLDVLFVGVRCPLALTEKREKERGDRNIGTARYQFERVHSHGVYDLEVDTSVLDVKDCVARIMLLVSRKPKKLAFKELLARFSEQK